MLGRLLIYTYNFEIQTNLTVSKQILEAKNDYFHKEDDAVFRKREATLTHHDNLTRKTLLFDSFIYFGRDNE